MATGKRRSERMRSIEHLSQREAHDLAGQMERQAEAVRAAEARLRELTDYLNGYVTERAEKSQSGGVSAMQLTESHLFLERLKEAVSLQERVVEQARSALEAARARWIAQHVRTSALGSAVHRFQEEESKEAAQREQRLQDEVAARYHKPRVEE